MLKHIIVETVSMNKILKMFSSEIKDRETTKCVFKQYFSII